MGKRGTMAPMAIGIGCVIAYVAFAIFIVHDDRVHAGGGWISLSGMISYLVTLPVSWLFDQVFGSKLDHKKNSDMAIAIGGCAVLVYFVVSRLASVVFKIIGK